MENIFIALSIICLFLTCFSNVEFLIHILACKTAIWNDAGITVGDSCFKIDIICFTTYVAMAMLIMWKRVAMLFMKKCVAMLFMWMCVHFPFFKHLTIAQSWYRDLWCMHNFIFIHEIMFISEWQYSVPDK